MERSRKETPQDRRLAWVWQKGLEKPWLSIWGGRGSVKPLSLPSAAPGAGVSPHSEGISHSSAQLRAEPGTPAGMGNIPPNPPSVCLQPWEEQENSLYPQDWICPAEIKSCSGPSGKPLSVLKRGEMKSELSKQTFLSSSSSRAGCGWTQGSARAGSGH